MKIYQFRDALRLLTLLGTTSKKLFAELEFCGWPRLEFEVGTKPHDFDYSKELQAMESATCLALFFDVNNTADISFHELVKYSDSINQLNSVIHCSASSFKVEFGVNENTFDHYKKVVCLTLVSTPIGSHIVGVILSLTGFVQAIGDDKFMLMPDVVLVESKFVVESGKVIDSTDIVQEFERVEKKYETDDVQVVNLFDKGQQTAAVGQAAAP